MRSAVLLIALLPAVTACCWLGGNAGQVAQIPPPNPPGPAARPVVVINGVECPVVEPLPCRVTNNGLNADQLERITHGCRTADEVLRAGIALEHMGEEGYVRLIRIMDGKCFQATKFAIDVMSEKVLHGHADFEAKYRDLIKPRILSHIRGKYTELSDAACCTALRNGYFDFRGDIEEAVRRAPPGHQFQAQKLLDAMHEKK
jgi:hypothetical protein